MKRVYYPYCVQIELVQGCNRQCEFCGTRGIEHRFHFVQAATLSHTAKLLRDSGFRGRLLLAGHGEPTLHPDVISCVALLHEYLPKSQLSIFTNGAGLLSKPDMLGRLFRAGANTVMVDEYSNNRVGAQIECLPAARQLGVEHLGRGVPMFKRAGQRILIAPPVDENRTAGHRLCNHCGAGMPKLTAPLNKPCSIIFRDFFVRWDGGIAICCNDFRGEYPVTNIMGCATFDEAYYHPRLEAARRILMRGERSFYPCSVCDVIPNRPGLLPDPRGQYTMPLPTQDDYSTAGERRQPLAVIVRREYEGGGQHIE